MKAWLYLILLIAPLQSLASEPSGYRLFTFTGDNSHEATETLYLPSEDGLYETKTLGAFTQITNHDCEDLVSQHQIRALDTMLKNKYITKKIYDVLTDPSRRPVKLSQYILATSFVELTEEEARKRNIPPERWLDHSKDGKSVRIHMGSLFFIRGYEITRTANNVGATIAKLPLPFELGELPTSLEKPVDRRNLTAAIEIGRAFIEEGAPRDEFPKLMHILGNALAADAETLDLDPETFAIFGHSYDAQHARLFAMLFPARPLTPEKQTQLEQDPRTFFSTYLNAPMPTKEEWKKLEDAVSVGSLKALNDKFPPGQFSKFAHKTSASLPLFMTPARRLKLMREVLASMRHDYDFKWPDEHRPGQRKPIQVRDFGTALWLLDVGEAIDRAGLIFNETTLKLMLDTVEQNRLVLDPDMGQGGWFERSIFIPATKAKTLTGGNQGAIVVSNLDPAVPSKEVPTYLAEILLAITSKIEMHLKNLSSAHRTFVAKTMNSDRAAKGLPQISESEVNLDNYLKTYDLLFASDHPLIKRELPIMGGSPQTVLKLHNKWTGGKENIHLDAKKMGLALDELLKDPTLLVKGTLKAFGQIINDTLSVTTAYRFSLEEVLEQRGEHPHAVQMGAQHLLQDSYHPQRIRRLFITFQ